MFFTVIVTDAVTPAVAEMVPEGEIVRAGARCVQGAPAISTDTQAPVASAETVRNVTLRAESVKL